MAKSDRSNLTNGRVNAFTCPPDKAQVFLWDAEVPGLAVRATKNGAKAYIFQGWINGAALRSTMGDTKVWTLGDARTEARRLKTQLDQGIDPREVQREKVRVKAAAAQVIENRKQYTLHALCDAYVAYLVARGKNKSAINTKSSFKVHVIEAWPEYAALPVQEVTSHQIAAMIRKVREKGKERTAGILRNYLTAAFNAARRAPFDSAMPSSLIAFEVTNNPAGIVPTIPVQRGNRTLNTDELKKYIAALGEDAPGRVLQVALLAGGQRIAQLIRAKPSDFAADTHILRLWDTKGKRTHAREHLLPLGPRATAVITALVEKCTEPDSLLFGIQEQVVSLRVAKISREMGGPPFNLRDIRRTVETQLAGMGIHKDTRAQLLSHGISGVQAAHYDRYEYSTEKKNALLAWESRLDEITDGTKKSNVIDLNKAA